MVYKNKLLPSIILSTMYLVGFLFAFSGDLILQIETARHHNQINKKKLVENISLSLSQRNDLNDQLEIKIKNFKSNYDLKTISFIFLLQKPRCI
jgi:hypothetical protein